MSTPTLIQRQAEARQVANAPEEKVVEAAEAGCAGTATAQGGRERGSKTQHPPHAPTEPYLKETQKG